MKDKNRDFIEQLAECEILGVDELHGVFKENFLMHFPANGNLLKSVVFSYFLRVYIFRKIHASDEVILI